MVEESEGTGTNHHPRGTDPRHDKRRTYRIKPNGKGRAFGKLLCKLQCTASPADVADRLNQCPAPYPLPRGQPVFEFPVIRSSTVFGSCKVYCLHFCATMLSILPTFLCNDVKYTAYIFVHRCKVYCLHQRILDIDVKYTAYIFRHRCKVYCLHFCASMHKNVGSILYIVVEKCRQYTLHRCTKM